jgi:trans-aconitate methyltransferase
VSGASARQAWIVEQVPLRGDEHVVELGCGHGVAAGLLCDRLPDGTYLGIDRSPTMVTAAARRTRAHVEAGRARFETATVVDAAYPGAVDVVLAIHLPVLDRGDPATELAVLRRHLAPGGRLHVGFQPLDPDAVVRGVDRLGALAAAHGFALSDVARGAPEGRPTAVVELRPTP